MPRDLTHVIIADDILKRSKDSWAKGVAEQSTAMHMGAIAHDSFLYGPSPKLSTKMHGGFGDDPRAPASWDRHGLRPRGFDSLLFFQTLIVIATPTGQNQSIDSAFAANRLQMDCFARQGGLAMTISV